ncbi:P-loop containing nucleoside triphosphate hydrolase protein [Gilbertella persicaria]|uniref:P-loop containing nucleoside triphosphate hydrolase protein n=1 Tax=Gilbertella persicaria TaxID=101096 RepID=UPI00221F8A2E|nr:P-loop containing nucleoside triphosphate hydrolase protein [Gilbertella persicaria]KAI8087955.1 P-loop containing nucleoside triphosphate hydrolase protein [Gilbertella persicaria]
MPKRRQNEKKETSKKQKIFPDPLHHLLQVFKQLNVFCTFCQAHLTTVITFENLQKSMPHLTLDDLIGIHVIMPHFVHVHTSDHGAFEIEFGQPWIDTTRSRIKLQTWIEQQNTLFIQALTAFVDDCEKKQLNITEHIQAQIDQQRPKEENKIQQTLRQVVTGFKSCHFYDNQLENSDHQMSLPNKEASYDTVTLSPQVQDVLDQQGIHLYTHQAEAIRAVLDGHHVIVSTQTASGKSFIYQLPVLERLIQDPASTALFLFPTKALAQDQMRALIQMLSYTALDVMVSTFDGDTEHQQRTHIRRHASVVFTNPDMLHHAILPYHSLWHHFLVHLKYIVVDELHVYHDVFGTHMAWIMRRLRRLCSQLGNHQVQFICCSATLAEPEKHMKAVFGLDHVCLVDSDGAPHGQKEWIVWNPSQKSAIQEGANILEYLIEHQMRTIAFCKVRKSCELLTKQVKDNLIKKQRHDLVDKITSYRGGYLPEQRRRIEQRMFDGELLGIIATNALELGIDIGTLDAVVMIGVPWSMSSLWQQSGRAGRRNADSLSLVICDQHPFDQYYAKHPRDLFTKKPDTLMLDLENVMLLESHVQCAAEEAPIHAIHDQFYFGSQLPLLCQSYLTPIGDERYRPDPRFRPYPSQFVSIRGTVHEEDLFFVVDMTNHRRSLLEQIELRRVAFELYEGAIFIHQGKSFLVEECNLNKKYACVHLVQADWTTQQRHHTQIDILHTISSKPIGSTKYLVCFGRVKVSTVVYGYYRLDKRSRIIDTHEVYMDPIVIESEGVWVDIPSFVIDTLISFDIDPKAAIHAAGKTTT